MGKEEEETARLGSCILVLEPRKVLPAEVLVARLAHAQAGEGLGRDGASGDGGGALGRGAVGSGGGKGRRKGRGGGGRRRVGEGREGVRLEDRRRDGLCVGRELERDEPWRGVRAWTGSASSLRRGEGRQQGCEWRAGRKGERKNARRAHFPKSSTLFPTTVMPSTTGTSTGSYRSLTTGRKKTSLPPGRRAKRASRTRSTARSAISYGLNGGRSAWAWAGAGGGQPRERRSRQMEKRRRGVGEDAQSGRTCDALPASGWPAGKTNGSRRSFVGSLRPRRFAPARTP